MDLQALKLHQAVIEVRYPSAYRAFDHAGEVAEQVTSARPDWVLTGANPASLTFARNSLGLTAVIGVNSTTITQVQSDDYFDLEDGKHFSSDYEEILSAAFENYRVNEFLRLGYRTIYNVALSDRDQALAEWNRLPFVKFKLPEKYASHDRPGGVALFLNIDDDTTLRFEVQNLDLEINVGGAKINWARKRVYKLPSEQRQRKKQLEALVFAERKYKHLPGFGLQIDLDWAREDVLGAKVSDVKEFVAKCDARRKEVLHGLLEVK